MNISGAIVSAGKHLTAQVNSIPASMIYQCKGIVFMTCVQGGFVVSGGLASGIIVKRLGKDKWSPPSSCGLASVGFGLQIGLQKIDLIIVLTEESQINAFSSRGQLKLSTETGLAAVSECFFFFFC